MAEILTDRDLRHEIEKTIRSAQTYLFVVSPYINFDEDMKHAISSLKDEVIKGIVYRSSGKSSKESGINEDSRYFLRSISNVEFIAVKNLHAKIYLNDEKAIISSMNLTKSSNYNYEIGTILDCEIDYDLYMVCVEYLIGDIINSESSNMDQERLRNLIPKRPLNLWIEANSVTINDEVVDLNWFESIHEKFNIKYGFCIRCGTNEIKYFPKRPFYLKCFAKWNGYKNADYEEKYCHRCGQEEETFIHDSQCQNCYEIYLVEVEREWKKKSTR